MRFPEGSQIEGSELAQLLETLLQARTRTADDVRARLASNVVVASAHAAICRRAIELLRQADVAGEKTYFAVEQRDEVRSLIRILRLQIKLDETQ